MHRLLASTAMLCLGLLSCIPRPVDRPVQTIVCITFDDAHPTVWSIAFPMMRSVDTTFVATHFAPLNCLDTSAAGTGITVAKLKAMEAAGWETAGHTWHHVDLSAIPLDSAQKEIDTCLAFLERNGLRHSSFAYPSGSYTAAVESLAATRFVNLRTAHDMLYTTGVNRKELGYFAVKGGMSANDIIARVERARALGAPLVIIGFHAVFSDYGPIDPNIYWTRKSIFNDFLWYLKNQELPVMTVERAMERIGEN